MTTVTEKQLTVERYEFYKTQATPMTDKQIMAIYGMDHNQLHKWKTENDLIGKKYEPKMKTSTMTSYKKSEQPVIPLLKENDIEEIRKNEAQKKLTAQIAQKQPPEPVKAMETITPKETPTPAIKRAETKQNDEKQEWQELKNSIVQLQEENADLKRDYQLKHQEVFAALERGDRWRDEKLAVLAEFEAFEKEAAEQLQREKYGSERMEKAFRQEIERLEAALELHAKDEQLALLLSEKFVSMGQRLQNA